VPHSPFAKDAAIISSVPIVDNARIRYASFGDTSDPGYKAPWNTLVDNARVYTPRDTAIQSASSDTPNSWLGADPRTEPLELTVPEKVRSSFAARWR
jgi:hypothetical protein